MIVCDVGPAPHARRSIAITAPHSFMTKKLWGAEAVGEDRRYAPGLVLVRLLLDGRE